ncbi:unnamed protein product [Rhizoctonia solani]|uniref:DUF6699 domain-containing protein n=1 Tax=Rhizoctonia solani TaxID=456999 RepID=A0A8H3GVA8_9AGAM|nr:unnamed protein product [Rhizoctonia solani]
MSLRPHDGLPNTEPHNTLYPEIHHPRPTRPLAIRRVTIAAMVDEASHPSQPHCVPAIDAPDNEKVDHNDDNEVPTPGTDQRSPSAPAALSRPPAQLPLKIHSILTVPSALRSRSHIRLTWDVRFSPDTPPPSQVNRRDSTCSHHSNSTLQSWHSNSSTTVPNLHMRPRSNTQPGTELELASDMHARLNLNYNSYPVAEPISPSAANVGASAQAFGDHPLALEPATSPPRSRMLIICRDLLEWFIPIYASDPGIGCTVLDVVRGIYKALQRKVEVSSHTRSSSDGTRAGPGWKRVEWLRDKTVFVCIGRDEALARRRVPKIPADEVFVLTLARRRE